MTRLVLRLVLERILVDEHQTGFVIVCDRQSNPEANNMASTSVDEYTFDRVK